MTQLDPDAGEAVSVDPVETATGEAETAEPQTVDALYPDDAGEAEPDDEGQGDEIDDQGEPESETPAIAAPSSWSAEDKAVFEALAPEAQAIVARREAERDKAILEKTREAATVRRDVVTQAEAELASFREAQAAEYQQLAARFMPQPPNPELLYTGNPADAVTYQQQRALFEAQTAQQQQLQQRAQAERTEAQRIRETHEHAWGQEQNVILQERLPEWFDPESGPKLQRELQSIGAELGYPSDLMVEANANDILALKTAAGWKADAVKWRAYEKSKRNANGTFKATRQIPPVARPSGNTTGAVRTDDPVKLLYPND